MAKITLQKDARKRGSLAQRPVAGKTLMPFATGCTNVATYDLPFTDVKMVKNG